MNATTQIDLEHSVPDPERPGYLKFAGTPTYREVFDQLRAALDAEGLIDEYFEPATWLDEDSEDLRNAAFGQPMPRVRFVQCYAVTGGSEGHYVHIDFLTEPIGTDGLVAGRGRKRVSFALGKTFLGWDHAWTIAKRVAELLGA